MASLWIPDFLHRARFSSLRLSILPVRLSPLTSSSSNGRLVLLVQVLLEMVNWSDPAEIAQDSGMPTEASGEPFWFFEFRGLGAFLKLGTYTLFGVYVWELFMTCDFEWSLITRRRRFRWPLVRWLSISTIGHSSDILCCVSYVECVHILVFVDVTSILPR
jgi:hypothetical protein